MLVAKLKKIPKRMKALRSMTAPHLMPATERADETKKQYDGNINNEVTKLTVGTKVMAAMERGDEAKLWE